MEQKRFLTADEVFQQFGVDQATLEKLVESGAIEALPDQGKSKYRSLDFARLVKEGKLTARTAGEMFQVDDKGEMPFLKLKQEDRAIKFNDDISFIELDEEALEEARTDRPGKTPVVPDKWFDDEFDPEATSTSAEISTTSGKDSGEQTEHEMRVNRDNRGAKGSDSDVRLVPHDGMIDLDDPSYPRSGSDSDVQLEGPLSSYHMPSTAPKSNMDSDSDVRLAPFEPAKPKSDSDVVLVTGAKHPVSSKTPHTDSAVTLSKPAGKKPESDSDVTLAAAHAPKNAPPALPVTTEMGTSDSDSDVVLVDLPSTPAQSVRPAASGLGRMEADSNVRLESPSASRTGAGSDDADAFAAVLNAAPDSDIKLSDSAVRFESAAGFGPLTPPPVVPQAPAAEARKPDSDIQLSKTEPEFSFDDVVSASAPESAAPKAVSDLDETTLEGFDLDEIEIEAVDEANSTLQMSPEDFAEIEKSAAADSDIKLSPVDESEPIEVDLGSGISFADSKDEIQLAAADSGITLDATGADSGITLQADDDDLNVSFDNLEGDSGIQLVGDDGGSGITLDPNSADSGISIEATDSGIRFESANESGIMLMETDSGISLEDDVVDFDHEGKTSDLAVSEEELRDSGFDVSLSESANTIEMDFDEEGSSADTVVSKDRGKKKKGGTKNLNLSEAFQLDEPPEVEDLDISDDLESAAGSDEFASIDDDVEASDEHFGSGTVSIAEDDDESKADLAAEPVAAKTRPRPYEPSWGLGAVLPIMAASVVMAATSTVLWGGIATMWTGAEAPGPAAALISILAGLL